MNKVGGSQIVEIDFVPTKTYGNRLLVIVDDENFEISSINCLFVDNPSKVSVIPAAGKFKCENY